MTLHTRQLIVALSRPVRDQQVEDSSCCTWGPQATPKKNFQIDTVSYIGDQVIKYI